MSNPPHVKENCRQYLRDKAAGNVQPDKAGRYKGKKVRQPKAKSNARPLDAVTNGTVTALTEPFVLRCVYRKACLPGTGFRTTPRHVK